MTAKRRSSRITNSSNPPARIPPIARFSHPYPKTGIRQQLLDQGLVTNPDDYTRYNGMWANVKTRRLSSDELQFLFWYHNQTVMGWWNPSERIRSQGRLWTSIWLYVFKPLLKVISDHRPGAEAVGMAGDGSSGRSRPGRR